MRIMEKKVPENISAKMKELAGEVDKIIFKPLGHAFERVTEEMHATWSAKNADYGSSFDGQGREWR